MIKNILIILLASFLLTGSAVIGLRGVKRTDYTQDDACKLALLFDGNVTDSSPANNTVTNNGADYNSNGKYGGCYTFVSSNTDYMTLPDGDSDFEIGTNDSFTITVWVKFGSGENSDTPTLFYGDKNDPRWKIYFWNDGPGVVVDDGTKISASGGTVNDDTWHFLMGVRDADANKLHFYTGDGVSLTLQQTLTDTTGSLIHGTYNQAVIGVSMDSGNPRAGKYYEGEIDELGFWRRALTFDEGEEIMRNGLRGNN